jgi:hypothetical protein
VSRMDAHFVSTFPRSSSREQGPRYQSPSALPGRYDGVDAIKRAYDDYHKGTLEHDETGIMIHS